MGVAFERFGLEARRSARRPKRLAALETVEKDGTDDLAIGAALGANRLAGGARAIASAVDRALDQLEECGADATALARAERFRLARAVDHDRAAAAEPRRRRGPPPEPTLHVGDRVARRRRSPPRIARPRSLARNAAAVHFDGAARAALEASAALVGAPRAARGRASASFGGDEAPAQLMNLELALPGCDPRRRSVALHGLGDALGDDAPLDARRPRRMERSRRRASRVGAQLVPTRARDQRPGDVASWEGVRAASESLGDHVQAALACAQLGALCTDAERGASSGRTPASSCSSTPTRKDDAEIAFERAFDRDPRRSVAFDKLFRAVRARNEDDRLLAIIAKRLEVGEDEAEIGKLYWERARVLRKKGDTDGALGALENVTMLEPDHVGALALSGEILHHPRRVRRGGAVPRAPLDDRGGAEAAAPDVSGVAAVDLYENKLGAAREGARGAHRPAQGGALHPAGPGAARQRRGPRAARGARRPGSSSS